MKYPLVFLSGLLSNQTVWKHQLNTLSKFTKTQVITSTENTPEKMVSHILENVPPSFGLVGHSMGGWLCFELMKKAPERVKSLCLINTTARPDAEEKRKKRIRIIKQAESGNIEQIIEENIDSFVWNESVKEDVKNMFLSVGPQVLIAQETAMLAREESLSVLPQIHCPTLVIHAAHDKIFSLEEHIEIASQVKNGNLVVIENSGHMSPMESPNEVTTHLSRWLADS